jgi:hypothetical protein
LPRFEVLEWIANQKRGKFRGSRNAMKLIAAIIGAATPPLMQLPNLFDMVSPGSAGNKLARSFGLLSRNESESLHGYRHQ